MVCTWKIDVYPEVYKSSENKLALLTLIDEHPTGKYYILGETYHPPTPTPTSFTLLAIINHLQTNFACRNITQLEERKPTRCNNIDDLLSIVDVDY